MTSKRDFENNACSRARVRTHCELAAKFFSPHSHTCESLTVEGTEFVEAPAIIAQFQYDHSSIDVECDFRSFASGMPRYVVHRFLENQEDLTPDFGAYLDVLLR